MLGKGSRIFLIGPMGSGKTTVGKALALSLIRPFLDLDEEVVRTSGMSIPEIFALEGEAGFRKKETEALRNSLNYNAVIATGGGVVVTPENLEILKSGGLVCYLYCPVEQQYQRTLRDNGRPMIDAGDRLHSLQKIFTYRDPLYRSICDLMVNSGDSDVHSCVLQIRSLLKKRGSGGSYTGEGGRGCRCRKSSALRASSQEHQPGKKQQNHQTSRQQSAAQTLQLDGQQPGPSNQVKSLQKKNHRRPRRAVAGNTPAEFKLNAARGFKTRQGN